MASLSGVSVASSYTSLLKLSGNTDTLVAGNGSNAIQIVDGDGTTSPLFLNTDRLGIGGQPTDILSLTADDPHIGFVDSSDSNKKWRVGVANNEFRIQEDGVATPVKIAESSVDNSLVIDGNGAIGIGTANPKHYSGTSGTILSIHNSSFRGVLELSGASNSDGGVIGAITFANTENTSANGALAQIYTEVETSDSNAGDDSGGHLTFFTKPEAGTLTERMRIAGDGAVGVGHDLSSHTQKLVVKNNASATTLTAGAMLNLVNEQGAGNTASIRFSGSQQNAFLGFFDGSSTATQRIAIGVGSGGTGDGHFNVTGDGNVGIGTSSPVAKMDILGDRAINITNTIADDTNKNAVITHSHYDSDTRTQGFTILQGFSSSTTNRVDIGGGTSQHYAAKEIKFHTASNNTTFTGTERMVIDNAGNILPGADDAQDLGSSSKRFDDIFSVNAVTTGSDKRLKDNIADSSLGLDFINALRPVKYKWKDYTYDVEKEEAIEAKEAEYETVVVQEAVEAKEAVMGTRQKTVSKEVEKTKTEIVEEDGKYVQKEVSYTETVEEPQYEEVNLYDEDGEVIGSHKIPVMEEYEVEPAVEAVKEITEERLVSEAIEAKDAVMETKEKTFARTHFGLIAQEVEQVLKDSSLTNNDFAGLIYDEDADRYGIRYSELISPLIKAVQELSKKVTDLENK